MGWWSIWLLVGVLCIGLELIIPGLVIIFFGFGAVFLSPVLRFRLPFVSRLWVFTLKYDIVLIMTDYEFLALYTSV